MHNKKAWQTRCRRSQRPRKRRSERWDKHLDHMTLTTLLPLHVSIDFCHADTHTCTQTRPHTHTNTPPTQAFSTLCKQFSSLFKTKVFLYPLNKTIQTRATDYVKSCLLLQTLSSVSFVVNRISTTLNFCISVFVIQASIRAPRCSILIRISLLLPSDPKDFSCQEGSIFLPA